MGSPRRTSDLAPAMQVIATAGHVDHGKSALLRALTGMEPDRWEEERRRGLTIDLGFVWTDLIAVDGSPVTVAFVDVPGHDGFLSNMLSGVGVVDRVLFVVAADDGWSAQSQEHLEILDLLGRRGSAVAVTKADLAGPRRTAEVVEDVARRLVGTSLHGTSVLAVDSLACSGVDELRAALVDGVEPGRSGLQDQRATRLWIDRSFTVTGAGTIVTGLLSAGHLEVGQDVLVAPHGTRGRVRGLQCLERAVSAVGAGSRAAVNLAGIDAVDVGRGDALLAAPVGGASDQFVSAAIDAELRALPHSSIGRTGAWHLHVGTAETTVDVFPLLGDLEPGTSGHARLELADPLPLRLGDRFVLRDAGRRRTVGGGVVLDPFPRDRRRGAERRLAHALVLEELAAADDDHERLVALVDAHGGRRSRAGLEALLGPVVEQIAGRAGSGAALSPAVTCELTIVGDQVVRQDLIEPWMQAVLAAADEAPAEHAVERARLVAAAAARGCPRKLSPALIDRAVDDGLLRTHGGRVVHHRHERSYLDARERRRAALMAALEAEPLQPPDPFEAAAQAGIPSFEVQGLLDDGAVVACGSLLFAVSAVEQAAKLLREGPGREGQEFTASDAKEAWDTTRRSAMPLLDHLRASGITGFDGTHHRVLRP